MQFIFDCTYNQEERTVTFNFLGIYNTASLGFKEKIEKLRNVMSKIMINRKMK